MIKSYNVCLKTKTDQHCKGTKASARFYQKIRGEFYVSYQSIERRYYVQERDTILTNKAAVARSIIANRIPGAILKVICKNVQRTSYTRQFRGDASVQPRITIVHDI